jgi:hypothetical protein
MIPSQILLSTLFIKAEQYGTAFLIKVVDSEYLFTARHLLDESKNTFEINLFFNNIWISVPVEVVGHGKGEIDISVLRPLTPLRPTPRESHVTLSIGGIFLGQDVYFLGFPYKMWSDVGALMGGLPCPLLKKGTLSTLGNGDPQILYVDAINNEGFSGGPLLFYPIGKRQELHIAGVVSKFRVEREPVLDSEGNENGMYVHYNTGFLVAYGIKHALDLIPSQSSA